MEIEIEVTEEEKNAVLTAIQTINGLQHVKYMSQAMIANTANIKATKVRHVLTELLAEGSLIQYAATENKKLQRFYYVIATDKLQPLLGDEPQQ